MAAKTPLDLSRSQTAARLHCTGRPQHGIRASQVGIALPRPCNCAPRPLKPLPRLTEAALMAKPEASHPVPQHCPRFIYPFKNLFGPKRHVLCCVSADPSPLRPSATSGLMIWQQNVTLLTVCNYMYHGRVNYTVYELILVLSFQSKYEKKVYI